MNRDSELPAAGIDSDPSAVVGVGASEGVSVSQPAPAPLTEDEYEAMPWCHIYPQYVWHAEAYIEGTRSALIVIKDAIEKALTSGMDVESESLFVTDGEGYHVVVRVRDRAHLEKQTLPYSAHYANGIGFAAYKEGVADDRKMKRAVRESKRAAANSKITTR